MLAYIFTQCLQLNLEFYHSAFNVLASGVAAITIYTKTDQRRIENC
jgi:hypothetical protein